MTVIGIWTRIDCRLAEMLCSFLHTPDLRIAMAMYQGLTGAEGKRSALSAAAAEALAPKDLLLFRAVMKVIRPSQERRNDYAHHLWGLAPELPDALLLADPKAWIRHNTQFAVRRKARLDPTKYADLLWSELQPFNRKHVKVYERAVLENDLAEANAADAHAMYLSFALSEAANEATDQARKALSSEPLVRQAIEDLSRESTRPTRFQRRLRIRRRNN